MKRNRPANDDVQRVRGRVISGEHVSVVKVDPIKLGADGFASAEVVFDRPVAISLSSLIPDPEERADLDRTLRAILTCESSRMDDILAAGGMDPKTDLVGHDFEGSEFVGTPERPLDLRGWDMSHCDLRNVVFEHILVDETTRLDGADLEGISGAGAEMILELQVAVPKGP